MNESAPLQPPSPEDRKANFWKGFFLVLGLHAIAAVISLTLEHFHAPRTGEQYVPQPLFLYILGISQLLYVMPLVLLALIFAGKGIVKGMLAAAALTFLLNGVYCGLMIIGSRFH
jgi:hypothetical protein